MEIYLDKSAHVEEYVEDLLSRLKIPSFGMTDELPMKNATRKKL